MMPAGSVDPLEQLVALRGSWISVPESTAAHEARAEVDDAKAVLQALQGKPEWLVQPQEISNARELVRELEAKENAAAAVVHAAREEKRREMYPQAVALTNQASTAHGEEGTGFAAELLDVTNRLGELMDRMTAWSDRGRRIIGQRQALVDLAAAHGDPSPPFDSVRWPAVPPTTSAHEALRMLRNAYGALGGGR